MFEFVSHLNFDEDEEITPEDPEEDDEDTDY